MATEGQFNPSKLDLILGVGVSELIYIIYMYMPDHRTPEADGPSKEVGSRVCVCVC